VASHTLFTLDVQKETTSAFALCGDKSLHNFPLHGSVNILSAILESLHVDARTDRQT